MTPAELLTFMRTQSLAVQTSVSPAGAPQAAVVGIAVGDDFCVFFDTLESTRKMFNLRRNSRIALVIGGLESGSERTVQYEGIVDEPEGSELEALKEIYFAQFPDGPARGSWPGLIYVRCRPTWIRYSDFDQRPPLIVEFDAQSLRNGTLPIRQGRNMLRPARDNVGNDGGNSSCIDMEISSQAMITRTQKNHASE